MKKLCKMIAAVCLMAAVCITALPVVNASAATAKATTQEYVMTEGQWTVAQDYGETFMQFTVPQDGYVAIQASTTESVKVLDANRAVIYSSVSMNNTDGLTVTLNLKAGTYYLYDSYIGKNVGLAYAYLGAQPFELKSGQSMRLNPGNSANEHYIKFKATKTGYATLGAQVGESAYVTFCNSSKKALTEEKLISGNSEYNNQLTFGVKKGKTYYFKVKESYGAFTLGLSTKSVKEKSGASKKKAVAIKAKKTVKGTIEAGNKKTDWYKISVPKTKSVKITFKGAAAGSLKIQVYTKSGKSIGSSTSYYNGFSNELKSVGKLSKGTYYIKVSRANSKSTGYYTIKWK